MGSDKAQSEMSHSSWTEMVDTPLAHQDFGSKLRPVWKCLSHSCWSREDAVLGLPWWYRHFLGLSEPRSSREHQSNSPFPLPAPSPIFWAIFSCHSRRPIWVSPLPGRHSILALAGLLFLPALIALGPMSYILVLHGGWFFPLFGNIWRHFDCTTRGVHIVGRGQGCC